MIYLALCAAALGLLIWFGRRPLIGAASVRWARAILGGLAALTAVAEAARGGWIIALGLIVASVILSRPFARRPRLAVRAEGFSDAQARSILGVGHDAGRAEIEAAYRRLMQRVHPDVGGAEGLAAQLNAARDRLLKPGSGAK